MDQRTDIIYNIREFNRFYTNILGLLDRSVLDSGYSLTEARILYEMNKDGRCIANTLCARLHIDKSYLSRILSTFEKKGLAYREASPSDGRTSVIALTVKGKETVRTMNEKSNDQLRSLLASLSDTECGEVLAAMHTIKTGLSKGASVTIRPYTDADIDFVITHQIKLYETEYGFVSAAWKAYVTDGVRRLSDQFDGAWDCMYIAEYSGAPAGCIAIVHTGEQTAQLRFFFVSKTIRGMGMGSRLMDLAVSFCREKQYQRIFLWTFSTLAAARHLYRKHGFRITDTHENNEWGGSILEERWDLDLRT